MAQKNSGAGPKWVVKQEKLPGALILENQFRDSFIQMIREVEQEENPLIDEASAVFRLWFGIYHSVVRLVAAMNAPAVHPINTREDGFIECPQGVNGRFCHENSYMLPAFGLEEDDSSSLSGLFFEKMINRFKLLYSSGALGRRFIHEVNSARSVAENLIAKYKKIPLDDFSQLKEDIRAGCLSSATDLLGHDPQANTFVKQALDSIDLVWGEDIQDHLKEVNDWITDQTVGTEEWWSKIIGLDEEFRGKLSSIFANGNLKTQLKIGQLAAICELLGDMSIFIENRFIYADDDKISHGVEGAIAKYQPEDQESWQQLLNMTRAAVAWQVVNQARTAVRQANTVLV